MKTEGLLKNAGDSFGSIPTERMRVGGSSPTLAGPAFFNNYTNGFTLVEIILSISLAMILFATTAILLDRGIASFGSISKRGSNNQDARFAMERMVRELILIKSGSGGDLSNIQTTQVSFKDKQGLSTDFHLTGSTLYRGNDPLLNHVTGLTFTGYKSDNSTTSAVPQTQRIRIQLVTLPEGQTATLVLRTDVFLRSDMYVNFQ